MFKKLFIIFQKITPQHGLTVSFGRLANIRTAKIKNFLIKRFIKRYNINMQEALIEDPERYPTFNDFFIRQLKPALRPIAEATQTLVSPVDGTIAQIGTIQKNQLLQAKAFYFDLETLLGGDQTMAQQFYHGSFATLYLAPYNYHRVHMPIDGKLIKTIYVPGKLFSVNRITTDLVPGLYSRNERLICLFETPAGPIAIILVGALIVGSIQTSWMNAPVRHREIVTETPSQPVYLTKGAEIGYFKLGSTVIMLTLKDRIRWSPQLKTGDTVQMGESFAELSFL